MAAQTAKVYKSCDAFIAELTRQYQIAIVAIEADIAKWYQRFADANGITLAEAGKLLNSDELEEFQWTVEEYIRRGEQNAVSGQWMKELESASARVHISRLESLKMQLRQHAEELIGRQLKTLPEILHATYREGYDRTVYELSKGAGVMLSYQGPDFRRIDRVLGTPWSSDGKEFSERVWENRAQLVGSMNQHITQSIIRGEDPQKAINAIAKDMNVSKARAGTLVMTESAAIATRAQLDCFEDLDVEELEFQCALSEKTCGSCGDMDKLRLPRAQWEIGSSAPPLHPNCRCHLIPVLDDRYVHDAERAARDENGKTVSVPAEMTYEQWKKEQDAKFGEGYIDKQRKKAYNEAADRKQFEHYRVALSGDFPYSFSEFQELKYTDSDTWDMIKIDYRRRNKLFDHPEYALPNADNVTADDRKFTGYLFNPDNADGWAKGTLFTARLGYDKDSYEDLKRDILRRATIYPAMSKGVLKKQGIEYGERFEQKIIMYGKTGKPTNVVVAWIKEGTETRMTSAYIKEVD